MYENFANFMLCFNYYDKHRMLSGIRILGKIELPFTIHPHKNYQKM